MKEYRPASHETPLPARVVAEIDRLTHQYDATAAALEELQSDVDAHSRTLTDLAATLRLGTEATGDKQGRARSDATRPVDWITVTDPAVAVAILADLTVWVARVWTHYAPLVACWAWHPAVVAEILSCRSVWGATVDNATGPDALASWHDRWRPGTTDRVARALAACDRTGTHLDSNGRRWQVDPGVVDELAAWWATTPLDLRTHSAADSAPPGLTPER